MRGSDREWMLIECTRCLPSLVYMQLDIGKDLEVVWSQLAVMSFLID